MQYSLKELRARNNLTQQEIADRLGISRQQYITIEKNPLATSCERMVSIALILGVEIGQIFLGNNHTNSEVDELFKTEDEEQSAT